jgi:hypothetical protein
LRSREDACLSERVARQTSFFVHSACSQRFESSKKPGKRRAEAREA